MGGKKKGGAAKKDDDGKPDAGAVNAALNSQLESLRERIVLEQERSDKARRSENELRKREVELFEEFKSEESTTKRIVSEMNDQYTVMQNDMMSKISALTEKVGDLERQISEKKDEIESKKRERDEMGHQKKEEINELKQRIDEMSSDFADMLKDTLSKMQERIEFANTQWENEGDTNMLKKLDDINLK